MDFKGSSTTCNTIAVSTAVSSGTSGTSGTSGYGSTTTTLPPGVSGTSGYGKPGQQVIGITLTDDETGELEKEVSSSDMGELLRLDPQKESIKIFRGRKLSIDNILEVYQRLTFTDVRGADLFFQVFGPGKHIYKVERTFERFLFYEKLLVRMKKKDPNKYDNMHKGTPFFFLAWTAFEMGNFEKGLFYLDTSIAEDRRSSTTSAQWQNCPGCQLLTLQISNHPAVEIRKKIENAIVRQWNRFYQILKTPPSDHKPFLEKFIKRFLTKDRETTIITVFFSFILEFEDRYKELELRGRASGSVEPFITHLFKGGLIFESILKHLYPEITLPNRKKKGDPVETLGDIFRETHFSTDFGIKVDQGAGNLKKIYEGIRVNDMKTAFDTTSRLRNTTGHNLIWQDVENVIGNPEKYRALFEQQVNSIFYIVERKF